MRYLFTTIPGTSHTLPLVPLAHAALAAGHEVAFAASGPALRAANAAGLQTIAAAGDEAAEPYEELIAKVTTSDLAQEFPGPKILPYVSGIFGEVGARLVEGVAEAARTWRADAVVFPPNHVAGLLAARMTGLPAVLHGIGTPRPVFAPALAYLEPVAARLGVDLPAPVADVEIDLNPASLTAPSLGGPGGGGPAAAHRLPMRYTSYNGGAEIPPGLLGRGERPRVAVTLGSLAALYGEGTMLREIVDGSADLGIELVITTGGAELPALTGSLPPHVTCVDWVPLRTLLASCDAIVHHGGMGSTFNAFDAGVPQLAIPLTGPESVSNGRVAADRGTGIVLDPPLSVPLTAATVKSSLHELLSNPAHRTAAAEVAAEMREMPAPAATLVQLNALLGGTA